MVGPPGNDPSVPLAKRVALPALWMGIGNVCEAWNEAERQRELWQGRAAGDFCGHE